MSSRRMDLIKAAKKCSGALMDSYKGFTRIKDVSLKIPGLTKKRGTKIKKIKKLITKKVK